MWSKYSPSVKTALLLIRHWIIAIAQADEGIGELKECLKWNWNEVSYLPVAPQSGTTLRIADLGGDNHDFALLVHCQTRLVSDFKAL